MRLVLLLLPLHIGNCGTEKLNKVVIICIVGAFINLPQGLLVACVLILPYWMNYVECIYTQKRENLKISYVLFCLHTTKFENQQCFVRPFMQLLIFCNFLLRCTI